MEDQKISKDSESKTEGPGLSIDSMNYGKLAFLGVLSIALYKFLPLAMLAPAPLVLAILIYGRTKAVYLTLGSAFALWMFSSMGSSAVSFETAMISVIGYFLIYLNATLVGEIILRKVHPVRGLLLSGMTLVAISAGFLGTYIMTAETPIQVQLENTLIKTFQEAESKNKEVLDAGGERALMLKEMFSKPKEMAEEVILWLPAMTFIGIYLGLYLCLMIVLRNNVLWKKVNVYPYDMKDLIRFQVPFQLIYFVIFGLVLLMGHVYLGGETAKLAGSNILYCMGIFYFFQGFGIMLDFLTWLKVKGFFRSILVVITLWTAWRIIVLVGLFDLWANFRRFLNKPKNNEGDIQ